MLIELEELKHKINNSKYYGTDAWRDILDMAVDCDSKSRPKGEWIDIEVFNEDDHYISEWQSARCSNCGKYHTTPYIYYFDNFNYCPQCGADMRGADNE